MGIASVSLKNKLGTSWNSAYRSQPSFDIQKSQAQFLPIDPNGSGRFTTLSHASGARDFSLLFG